jgi:thiamine-phosphate pyrophosphorylase
VKDMRPVIPQPCLCLVTDRSIGDEETLVSRVVEAVAGGVDMVQLREKDLPGGRLLDLALSLKDTIGDSALLIINERVDVAVAGATDGVQLGEEALPVAIVRQLLGPDPLIGRSVHSLEGAAQAVSQGADFLIVGTMFVTRSHPDARPAGPELIRQIAQDCPVPLIGIGGINAANLAEVMRAGAKGVAVITSILGPPHPQEAARQLKQAMLAAWPVTRIARGPR